MWISMSWIAQFSNFYHDGKWPDKTQEDYNQFYDSLWKDIINPTIDGWELYNKYFSKVIGNHGIDERIFLMLLETK